MDRRLPIRNWFDVAYEGSPPWDIGRPQRVFKDLAEQGLIHGRVLDVGCGTGELALELAARGHDVVGVDASRMALHKAGLKAESRGLSARFVHMDALDLQSIGLFDTVVDCGLFHVFSDADRVRYSQSLARVVEPGGLLHLLCFSDRQPGLMGPRRVSVDELKRSFRRGWVTASVRDAHFETHALRGGARAYLATFARIDGTTLLH